MVVAGDAMGPIRKQHAVPSRSCEFHRACQRYRFPTRRVLVTAAAEERLPFRVAVVLATQKNCAILSELPRSPRPLSITRASFLHESVNLINGSAAHQSFPCLPCATRSRGICGRVQPPPSLAYGASERCPC